MCVGQRNTIGEERVVLFLKLHPDAQFTPEFTRRIVVAIRSELSARHVPAVILSITEIPVSNTYMYFFTLITLGLVQLTGRL